MKSPSQDLWNDLLKLLGSSDHQLEKHLFSRTIHTTASVYSINCTLPLPPKNIFKTQCAAKYKIQKCDSRDDKNEKQLHQYFNSNWSDQGFGRT